MLSDPHNLEIFMMAFKDGHKQILNQSPALLFSRV
jgi:hypothetical protein